MSERPGLVEQIEEDALDGTRSLSGALRRCITLGGKAGSAELRDWASRELKGYEEAGVTVPDYRLIAAPIAIDGFSGNNHITNQQISARDLPDVAVKAGLSEQLRLRQGVGALEDLVQDARSRGLPIRLGLPGGAELVKLMNHDMRDRFQSAERVYWNVAPAAVVGVLDQIRTRLVSLVAEIRATATDLNAPSEAIATNAFEVAVHGRTRDINITLAQGSGQGIAAAGPSVRKSDRPWWRRAKTMGALIVGLATIAGVAIAYLQLHK